MCGATSIGAYLDNFDLQIGVDKVRYDLIPTDALHEMAKVYTVGARKYAERNWEQGMSWPRWCEAFERVRPTMKTLPRWKVSPNISRGD